MSLQGMHIQVSYTPPTYGESMPEELFAGIVHSVQSLASHESAPDRTNFLFKNEIWRLDYCCRPLSERRIESLFLADTEGMMMAAAQWLSRQSQDTFKNIQEHGFKFCCRVFAYVPSEEQAAGTSVFVIPHQLFRECSRLGVSICISPNWYYPGPEFCFRVFLSPKDEAVLFEYLQGQDVVFLRTTCQDEADRIVSSPLDLDPILLTSKEFLDQLEFTQTNEGNCVNIVESPVIKFSRSFVTDGVVNPGNLWMSNEVVGDKSDEFDGWASSLLGSIKEKLVPLTSIFDTFLGEQIASDIEIASIKLGF